jgi:hypothetical protein
VVGVFFVFKRSKMIYPQSKNNLTKTLLGGRIMKSVKIFGLILLFSLLVILVPRIGVAQDRSNQGTGENCTWTAGKTSVSELPPEQREKLHGLILPEGYWEMWEKLRKLLGLLCCGVVRGYGEEIW